MTARCAPGPPWSSGRSTTRSRPGVERRGLLPARGAGRMQPSSIRIGNQTNSNVPARLPYEFAVRQGFDAFEWFSDKGRSGWCEDDTPPAQRAELLRAAREAGIL